MDETQSTDDPKVDNPIEYFKKICRVCLAPSENLYPIINVVLNHNHNGKKVSFSLNEVFNKYCDVVIINSDLKPQNICEVCLDVTSKAFSAFELFNASNSQLDIIISQGKNNENHSDTVSDILPEHSDANDDNQKHVSDMELLDATGADDDYSDDDDINATGDDVEITAIADDVVDKNATGSDSINAEESLDKSSPSKTQKKMEMTKNNLRLKIQRETQIFKCNLCVKSVFKGIKLVIEHINDVHPLEKRCILCPKTFLTRSDLLGHVNACHSNKRKHCRKCHKIFRTQKALDEHMESVEHMSYKFECTCHICKEKFDEGSALKKHILEVHFKENGDGQSSKSGIVFENKEYLSSRVRLQEKMEKAKKKSILCYQCGTVFPSDTHSHICPQEKIVKAKKTSFICCQCGIEFHSDTTLKLHHKEKHSGPFECDYCSQIFQTANSFFQHRVSHPECKNIVCPLCGEISENLADYKMHRAKNHNDYVCHICNKGFHKKFFLTQHLDTHSSKQLFECKICFKKFKFNSSLKLHMNDHGNKQSYTCNYCDKTFKRQRLLRLHKNAVHEKLKKFKCNKCDKAFTNNWTLSSHLRVHMGYKPFSCPFCARTFVDTTDRHRHVRRYHSDKMEEYESYKQTYQSEEVRIVNSIPITIMNRSSGDEQNTNDTEDEKDAPMITDEEAEISDIKEEECEVGENDLFEEI